MLGALIIESRDKDDPGSEGRFVRHMLNLMGVDNEYKRAASKADFIRFITRASLSKPALLHIATHGVCPDRRDKRQIFAGFWTPQGIVTIEDLRNANAVLSGVTVVSTACFSGQKVAREGFRSATGCEHYIGPRKGPQFYNAALTSHIFYHKHFVRKKSIRVAFSEYESGYRNPHVFCLL